LATIVPSGIDDDMLILSSSSSAGENREIWNMHCGARNA
jgi:hypothetical protein